MTNEKTSPYIEEEIKKLINLQVLNWPSYQKIGGGKGLLNEFERCAIGFSALRSLAARPFN
ncbi:hypothetical protein CW304_01245 [Bacillus sp. UFRGS-B20]|nr:hypothetical protein CW304_01245 [Bacillus sp. UFRGS-B20]